VQINRQPWVAAVNRFWFEELAPEDWFEPPEGLDETIRRRFGELHGRLRRDGPGDAVGRPDGALATVIVFDQFPRNIFRASPQAYATDDLALAIAGQAVDGGLDRDLGLQQRHVLYLPFMHAEDSALQARSVALFGALGLAEPLAYAEHHKAIVDRFGRFPHRNAILGRASTEAERDFLKDAPSFA
jgi:uncharacterized protein (DUF924 family)